MIIWNRAQNMLIFVSGAIFPLLRVVFSYRYNLKDALGTTCRNTGTKQTLCLDSSFKNTGLWL